MTNTEILDELEDVANKHSEVLIRAIEQYDSFTEEEKDRYNGISINVTAKVTDRFKASKEETQMGVNSALDKVFDKNR